MEAGTQIKKYRNKFNMTQDELAEKVYVSRQTISNWETNKNYPDIHSLILMSYIFGVSVDELVKGDMEEIKKQINNNDVKQMKKDGMIFSGLLVAVVLLCVPLFMIKHGIGFVLWILLFIVTLFYADRIEKMKKFYDVQTYREIASFFEGKQLDEIEKAREAGKRPYQTIMYVIVVGVLAFMIVMLIFSLFYM